METPLSAPRKNITLLVVQTKGGKERMLSMEQIYHIKYLKNHKGKSLREISKETGHHFETVRKYVEKENFNIAIPQKRKRKSKLEPFKHLIDQWLRDDLSSWHKQRHTAQRIYDRLKEIYGDEFDVSDRSVRKYVAAKKQELYKENEGFIPLMHYPGEAQADFGQAQFIEKGIKYDGYYLTLSFPYSNAGYIQLFKSENQECLLEGLKNIFEYIGGSPREIWFDNASTIVDAIRKEGERDINKGFQRFMLHYNFISNFCNANSGHEKGHVENKVGYVRRNLLVPIPEFDDIREFNKELLKKCELDMHRKHYNKAGTIAELFNEDKEALIQLPKIPFEVFRLEASKADNYGKVKYDGRIYSSSPEQAGKQVWVKAGAYEVAMLDSDYREIIRHDRLYGDQKESMKWVPYLEMMAKRPNALKYTGFFKELPTTLQDYFNKCSYEEKKAALKALARMVDNSDISLATEAFEYTISKGLYDADSIWAYYCRLISKAVDGIDIKVADKVPELKEYYTDTSIYDKLLSGGDSGWRQ